MPAIMRVATLTKVSKYARLMEFEATRKAAKLNEAKEHGATVKSSELEGFKPPRARSTRRLSLCLL